MTNTGGWRDTDSTITPYIKLFHIKYIDIKVNYKYKDKASLESFSTGQISEPGVADV